MSEENGLFMAVIPFLMAFLIAAVPLGNLPADKAEVEVETMTNRNESIDRFPGYLYDPPDDLPECYCGTHVITCWCIISPN